MRWQRGKQGTYGNVFQTPHRPKKNETMPKTPPIFQWNLLFLLILLSHFSHSSLADVGTASQYSPPYIPTECYGTDSSQFPSSNLFAAAGDGIWDNGASCGRQYMVRCISASTPRTCIPDQTILIKIVDHAATVASQPSAPGTTVVLSQTAFGTIANSTASSINIEFQQV
ncbi:EG45-like domain containing protein isoform X2 [Ziziphus jujuba]|uniref:EG45-like domain containing protein isoform X2 n=1 Tax=Ziziphus jujuba TaxID=326968 RepID=A0A6P4B9H0_ZIZJJ|nr:EG45-like domain containing protein isoform X2 [Ziziphus jujuba]